MEPEAILEIAGELKTSEAEGRGGESAWAATAPAAELHPSPHAVQFYNADASLVQEVGAFLGAALAAGNSALVLATAAHRRGFANELEARGLSLSKIIRQGRYIELDAAETLTKVMIDDRPDAERFAEVIGSTILRANAAAKADHPRAAVFGEMVALLWAAGKPKAALELERLWNKLAPTHPFALRCAYPIAGFSRHEHVEPFLKICGLHSAVLPTESYTRLATEEKRLRGIAEWQQKAQVLDGGGELPESDFRLRLFIDAVQDYAIFFLDTRGNVATWNPGAERIKGYKASEIIGKHFSSFYPEEDIWSGKPARELEVAARVGRFEDEGWRLRKDGSRFWANVIITAIRNHAGELLGFAKITRDFTERMRMQEALRRTNIELAAEIEERKSAEKKLAASERSLRDLSLRLLRSQDEERKRIGRDLHDSLGQYLAMLKLNLELLQPTLESLPDDAAERFSSCLRLADDAIREVRTISYLLYPPMLEQTGLKSAIDWYLDGFSKRSNIQTSFEADPDFPRLSREIELALFRVLQESLTNVHRHSKSATASVRLSMTDGQSVLEIRDEGRGIPSEVLEQLNEDARRSCGVGLRGMEERVRQLGGKLEIASTPNGTIIRATAPTEASSAAAAGSSC
jgi:PAS domain S-box-containing protein